MSWNGKMEVVTEYGRRLIRCETRPRRSLASYFFDSVEARHLISDKIDFDCTDVEVTIAQAVFVAAKHFADEADRRAPQYDLHVSRWKGWVSQEEQRQFAEALASTRAMGFSIRLANAIVNNRLDPRSIDQLCALSKREWMRTPNFGKKCLDELGAYLAAHGRSVGDLAA